MASNQSKYFTTLSTVWRFKKTLDGFVFCRIFSSESALEKLGVLCCRDDEDVLVGAGASYLCFLELLYRLSDSTAFSARSFAKGCLLDFDALAVKQWDN